MLVPRTDLPEGKPQKTKAPLEPTLQGTSTPKGPKGATKKRTVKPTSSANLPVGPTMLVPRSDLPVGKPQKTKAPLEPTLQGTSTPKGPKGGTKKRTHISALRLLVAQLPDNERERALAHCACTEASQEKVILASFLVKGEVDAATKKVADDQLPAIVTDKAMTARRAIYGGGKRPTKSAIRKAIETFLSPNDGHRMPLIIKDDDLNIVQIKALAILHSPPPLMEHAFLRPGFRYTTKGIKYLLYSLPKDRVSLPLKETKQSLAAALSNAGLILPTPKQIRLPGKRKRKTRQTLTQAEGIISTLSSETENSEPKRARFSPGESGFAFESTSRAYCRATLAHHGGTTHPHLVFFEGSAVPSTTSAWVATTAWPLGLSHPTPNFANTARSTPSFNEVLLSIGAPFVPKATYGNYAREAALSNTPVSQPQHATQNCVWGNYQTSGGWDPHNLSGQHHSYTHMPTGEPWSTGTLTAAMMAGAPDGITHEMMAASLDYTNAQQGNTFPHQVATLLHDLDAKTSQAPLALIEFGGPNMGRSTIGRHGMSLRAVLQFMKENIALASDTANDLSFMSLDSAEVTATLTATARMQLTHKDFALRTLIPLLSSLPADITARLGCANNLTLNQSSEATLALDALASSATENHLLLESAITTLHVAMSRFPCTGLNVAFTYLRRKMVAWRKQRTPPELSRRVIRAFLLDLRSSAEAFMTPPYHNLWSFPLHGTYSDTLQRHITAADRHDNDAIELHRMLSHACGFQLNAAPKPLGRRRDADPSSTDRTNPNDNKKPTAPLLSRDR